MAEEFPDHSHHYLYQNDLAPPPHQQPPGPDASSLLPSKRVCAPLIDDRTIRRQRRTEPERFVRKSLPNARRSYGSLYSAHAPTLHSESEPLLGKANVYGVYAEPIELTRYRRNQVFLAFYVAFYVGYLIAGSLCFQRLESGREQEIRAQFRLARQLFLADYPSVKGSLASAFFSLSIFLILTSDACYSGKFDGILTRVLRVQPI